MNQSALALLRQNRIFFIVVIFIVLCISIFSFMGVDVPESSSSQTRNIDLPSDKISAHDLWVEKMEASQKLIDQKLKYLQDTIIESKKQEIVASAREMSLQNEIVTLKNGIKALENSVITRSNTEKSESSNYNVDPLAYSGNFQDNNQEPEILVMRQPLREVMMPESRDKIHHVDEMIPAGTTVKALLVSSLDAVCGVFSTSDPTPIKLRILDNGHLPKCVNVKLKGGILIGSAYGNISSERVYMRLERLTQVQPNGDFVETGVTGYVSGEDGKYGVRGLVVDKSSKAVANAAASGFLAGVSQTLQSAFSRNKNVDSGNSYNLGFDIAAQGGASGSTSGLDMLAEYYIKRAEQIQPVIEVNAGRIVEVTFTLGVPTGDFHGKEVFKKIRQNNK